MLHLNLYIYKQQTNVDIVNNRNVRTRVHDRLLFTTRKQNNEKFKRNVYYKEALSWNSLSIIDRKAQTLTNVTTSAPF